MLAVLKNTLYMYVDLCYDHCVLPELSSPNISYGGIFERGSREYTLDDFYSIQLDKLERYTCLKHSGIVIPAEGDESSSDEDDEGAESDEDGDSDNETQVGEDEAGFNLKKIDDSHDDEADEPADVQVSAYMILLCDTVEIDGTSSTTRYVRKRRRSMVYPKIRYAPRRM
jgi:hypothetical protein